MSNFTITPAVTDDEVRAVAALADEIWHEHFTPIIGADQVAYMLRTLQSFDPIKKQIAQGYEYFLLEEDGARVGYSAVHAEDGALFLSKLYLRSTCRGKGYASRVMAYYISLCRKRGLGRIWLTCNRFNANSLKVYEHLGFRKIREEKADIGNGFFMDDYIMEKTVG